MSTAPQQDFRIMAVLGCNAVEKADCHYEGAMSATNRSVAYGQKTISAGIRSRFLDNINGLRVHMLEAGFDGANRPCVLLLHGFPELAYVWRKVMLPLASAGYYVIAPDLRGYGRTTGWDPNYDCDLRAYGVLNMVRDVLGLVSALSYRSVSAVIGRDTGSPLAGWCTLLRPDVFRRVALMTAPFTGAPSIPFGPAGEAPADPNIDAQLAALPRPRKYYQAYYRTRQADSNLRNCPQGLHTFFRAYFHYKSADWKDNKPFPLKAGTAEEMAKMPNYYVMDLDKGMCETVAEHTPIAASQWLTRADIDVFATEFARTGFQGALNYYRRNADAKLNAELQVFSGRTIDAPSFYIPGASDWGTYQTPGALDVMRNRVCTKMVGFHFVESAGHWVQQEQPEEVSNLLLQFLQQSRADH
jgi:pimeloyl-ACP methyl ester carboxylesterase